LLLAITRYDLPVETFVRLIDAHVFDVYDDPMPDMAALEAIAAIRRQRCTRCVRRCSAQVRLMSRVSLTTPALEGLTDVMLALPRCAARRQLYLPGDLMSLQGVIAEEVFLRRVMLRSRMYSHICVARHVRSWSRRWPCSRILRLPRARVLAACGDRESPDTA
jgi:hypothetical protein